MSFRCVEGLFVLTYCSLTRLSQKCIIASLKKTERFETNLSHQFLSAEMFYQVAREKTVHIVLQFTLFSTYFKGLNKNNTFA